MRLVPRRLIAVASAAALAAGLLATPSGPPARAAGPLDTARVSTAAKHDVTSKRERRRSKAVKTPRLRWYSCYGYAKCASVKVPRDYDHPKGKKVELAVLKVPARNQKKKIGTLFLNPGGPGGSGTEIAYYAPYILSPRLLERFDVVGFDPRGVAFSDNVRCFGSARRLEPVLQTLSSTPFPYTRKEEKAFTAANNRLARACSTTGKPLSAAVSTAEVARDMDLLRRAVGDRRLTYLGLSYGSYLGEVYANLYPDRVRALTIDGVLNPLAWAGTKKTAKIPLENRLRSGDGAAKALREILVRCDRAGGRRCVFAAGNPVRNFDLIAERLKRDPIVDVDPATGQRFRFGYPEFVGTALAMLYYPDGYDLITWMAADLMVLTEPPSASAASTAAAAARHGTALRSLTSVRRELTKRQRSPLRKLGAAGFPYVNYLDAFATITCTDSRNKATIARFPALADAADRRAPYFGRLWLWNSAACSSPRWRVKDEDAYRGPFTKRTSAPVLVVGNYWDPATNYAGAVSTAKLMPNSRLLRSDSWGHTAYGTSDCVTTAIDRYLLTGKPPRVGKVCRGDIQPFETDLDELSVAQQQKAARSLPVSPNLPGRR